MIKRKGFTLIELLVVIAIIGILASVVLASLNGARVKANQAAIKSNLNAIVPQATLFYDSALAVPAQSYDSASAGAGCAGGLFDADDRIAKAIEEAEKAGSGIGNATCVFFEQSWAVSVPFKDDNAVTWCTDYTGIAMLGVATDVASDAICQ